ncbi:MAG TPA: hypothetical protein VL335_02380 [Candidatus Paceibacterota bacterium]|jgi:hypothetical protein|nr:hypothetical protein [Candidatus Paceibacterota bacterium]
MADKKEKKEIEVAGLEIGALIGLIVLIAAWPSISEYLQVLLNAFGVPHILSEANKYTGSYGPLISMVGKKALDIVILLAFPVSLFFLLGIIYCVEQLKHIRNKEEEKYDLKVEPAYEADVKPDHVLADRWERVQTHISSDNESDWRQAIMEADIMLEDVLTTLGYQGEGIGEKLKRVVKGDMENLQAAWDAHLVRNKIAHDGTAFQLTKYEAQRVINLYKKVFEEFYYI